MRSYETPEDIFKDSFQGKNGATIYVVGTAHLSNNSNYQVLNLIEKVQPDRVMVELCPERQGIMYANEQMLMDRDEFTYEDFKRTVEQKGKINSILMFILKNSLILMLDKF